MSKPHKHAALIKAWADGAEIEFRFAQSKEWSLAVSPKWDPDIHYRIKPKPDVVRYIRVNMTAIFGPENSDNTTNHSSVKGVLDNLKLIFDGETGELKLAEVIK